ncbi:MAG: CBS domain-containing protein [Planctomycetota bacterium]|jgi:CBS domain-containing protein
MKTVEDILMSKGPDVIVAASSTTVLEASRLMAEANVGSIIIKDGDGPLGIFTERDLLKRVVAVSLDPATTAISEVMSSPVASCGLSDPVREVGTTMFKKHVRHLAIVEEGALIGVIGLRDVLTAELEEDEEIIKELGDQHE